MTLSTARFVPDRLGGPAELVRGGDRNNPTTFDGIVDVAGDRALISFSGDSAQGELLSPTSAWNPGGFDVRYRIEPGDWEPATAVAISRQRTYLTIPTGGGIRFSARHHDGVSASYPAHTATNNTISQAALHVRRVLNTVAGTSEIYERTDLTLPLADDTGWTLLDTASIAGFLVPLGATPGKHHIGRSDGSSYYTGAVAACRIDKLDGTVHDLDLQRDVDLGADGDRLFRGQGGDWTLPASAGAGLKAHLVAGRNQANLDGENDYWDLVGLDPWQVQGGGTVEVGFVLVVESIYELTASWGRLISTESENNRGLYLYAAPTGVANAGKLFCTLRSDTLAGSVTTPSRYDDIGRFAVAVRIGDVDGTRKISIRTNLEDWVENDLDTNVNDIAHGMPRIGSSAHLVSAGHPQSYSRCAVWDGNTAKTQAPSKADMSIALFEAFDGAGKA